MSPREQQLLGLIRQLDDSLVELERAGLLQHMGTSSSRHNAMTLQQTLARDNHKQLRRQMESELAIGVTQCT